MILDTRGNELKRQIGFISGWSRVKSGLVDLISTQTVSIEEEATEDSKLADECKS